MYIKFKTIILLALFLTSLNLYAGFRAREHYDYHQLNLEDSSYTYRGLSNTINYFFVEKPLDESIGIGFSTLGDNVENSDLSDSVVGEKISLYQIDIEYKWFPKYLWTGTYLRHGFGYSLLDTEKLDSFHGVHYQQALGYEIMFSSFGLALELSGQGILLEKGNQSLTLGVAIGFHFYKFM